MYTKTKAIRNLEQRIDEAKPGSLRHQILEHTKSFKTSWMELGQALYSAYRDKLFKEWGYNTFEAYCGKEIGIRKQTALKLLRSYYFLEKEGPRLLAKEYVEGADAQRLPTLESIDALRLAAKRKDLEKEDLQQIKEKVFAQGKDAKDVKKDLTTLIKQREELEPEEAWKKKKQAQMKRLVGVLKSLKEEIKLSKTLPAQLIKDIDKLTEKLEIGLN